MPASPKHSARSSPARPSSAASLRLPAAPAAIAKGSSLAALLDREAVACLAHNLGVAQPVFDGAGFRAAALRGLAPLGIMQRGGHLATVLRRFLPTEFEAAAEVLLRSLTPPLTVTADFGLGVFFYLPHVCFAAKFGLDPAHNGGRDPFPAALRLQYELTRRFSAEFSIRPFLIAQPERTLRQLAAWTRDPDPHVRRWCSEGTRPRLPWARRIPAFVRDPRPVLPILEALRDDPELYVRRSVANHLGDIAKDHADLAFEICRRWLDDAPPERRWLIRHALRHPAKHGVAAALEIRRLAR
jgi:3-methyladenine DNA glycosylase AlkC